MKQNLACKGLGISEALIFPHMSPVYQVHGIPVDIKPANVQGDWQSLGPYSMHIYIQWIWIWFWILFEFEFVFVLLYGPQMPCLSYIIRIHGFTMDQFPNLKMHLFYISQCSIQNRNVHISVLNGALWDMAQVNSGIC